MLTKLAKMWKEGGVMRDAVKILAQTGIDPAKKIEAWYSKKLKGWNHNKTYHAFLPPNKNVDVMSDKYAATPHVEIEQSMSKNQFDGRLFQTFFFNTED